MAHRAPVQVALSANAVNLAPDAAMLSRTDTAFPLFIDPTWTLAASGGTRNGYAIVNANNAATKYWNNTGDPNPDYLQVGDSVAGAPTR